VNKAVKYLTEHNVNVLRDSVVKIANSFYIIGREDREKERYTGTARKTIPELLDGIDKNLPMIMLDHQPFKLDNVATNAIDLQISGHTHHGQFFPMNLITKAIFEKSWGLVQKGNTVIYVSSGYGTWGPPVRIANHPEILNITMNFK